MQRVIPKQTYDWHNVKNRNHPPRSSNNVLERLIVDQKRDPDIYIYTGS